MSSRNIVLAAFCIECGECFDAEKASCVRRFKDYANVTELEQKHCLECGNEKFRGVIETTPARLFSAGSGCPLEPNGDASPWQENAIRDMEE